MWHPAVCPAVSFHPRRFTSAADVDADVAQLLPSTLTFERQSLQMITFHQAQPSNRRKSSWFLCWRTFHSFSFKSTKCFQKVVQFFLKVSFFLLAPPPSQRNVLLFSLETFLQTFVVSFDMNVVKIFGILHFCFFRIK